MGKKKEEDQARYKMRAQHYFEIIDVLIKVACSSLPALIASMTYLKAQNARAHHRPPMSILLHDLK